MLLSADTDAALSSAEEAESESPCNTHQVPTPKFNECQQQTCICTNHDRRRLLDPLLDAASHLVTAVRRLNARGCLLRLALTLHTFQTTHA